jgi:hypothetical protein
MSALRRDIDSKAYALLSVTLAILGIISAFGVWEKVLPNVRGLLVFTLVIYVATVVLGVHLIYPRPVFMAYSRAIQKFRDRISYDDLSESVALDILDLIDAGAEIIEKKSQLLEVMVWLIITGSISLLVSVIV